MSGDYKNTVEFSSKMMSGMEHCAELVGVKNENAKMQYGFVPGMGMSLQSESIQKQLASMREGVFSVMFTGGFSAGKSTVINALLHRDVLRRSINAETAIVTKIMFNKNPEEAVIVKKETLNGEPVKETMPIRDFFQEYRVDQEDESKFSRSVEYAALHLENKGVGGGMVQVIDSPGTSNSQEDTLMSRTFLKQANAVVYLINAMMPFTQEDKEYIGEHYEGKHFKNIFFIINRINQLEENDAEDVKESTRFHLEDVFTDENGSFDEELYRKRVFFVNALDALRARDSSLREKHPEYAQIAIDATGIPEFEAALEAFLTDDGRDRAAFQTYLPQLLHTYTGAYHEYQKQIDFDKANIAELENSRKKIDRSTEQMNAIYAGINLCCIQCVQGVNDDISRAYDNMVRNVDANWNAYFSNLKPPVKLKASEIAGIAGVAAKAKFTVNEAKKRKVEKSYDNYTEQVQKVIKEYLNSEIQKMNAEINTNFETRLMTLSKQLEIYSKQIDTLSIPISWEEILQKMTEAVPISPETGGGKINASMFQVLIGILALDPETVVGGFGGNKSNISVMMETLGKTLFEIIALYSVGWPIGLAMLGMRVILSVFQVGRNADTITQEMLNSMREGTVSALYARKNEMMMETEKSLQALIKGGEIMTGSIQQIIDDYAAKLNQAIENLKSGTSKAEEEEKRMGQVMDELFKTVNELNIMLNGKALERNLLEMAC